MPMKYVHFVGSSLDDLKNFPAGARREAGFELSNVQSGLQAERLEADEYRRGRSW